MTCLRSFLFFSYESRILESLLNQPHRSFCRPPATLIPSPAMPIFMHNSNSTRWLTVVLSFDMLQFNSRPAFTPWSKSDAVSNDT